MTLHNLFRKFDELSDQFSRYADEVFVGGTCILDDNDITIINDDGKVHIKGKIKELRINGRLVRFKEDAK